jgi:hypothetical protein
MATGLGMTADEWEALKAQVDDSFWVMRIIGAYRPQSSSRMEATWTEHTGI